MEPAAPNQSVHSVGKDGDEQLGLDLALRQNAYDFLNASIEEAGAAEDAPVRWKFAIVHLTQALELMLKARLALEHPLLVMSNIDRPGNLTVDFAKALERLRSCDVEIAADDIKRLSAARAIRNQLVHFHTRSTPSDLKAAYIDLFEFAHAFHLKELGGELHDFVDSDFHSDEAGLMESFRSQAVIYQGAEIHPQWAAEIIASQFMKYIICTDGRRLERIPCGDAKDLFGARQDGNCHDCSVRPGQLHGIGCDSEACPNCGAQFMYSCYACNASLADDEAIT